jgi:lysophospholipase L1-like esterase
LGDDRRFHHRPAPAFRLFRGLLLRALPETGIPFRNSGVSGDTISNALARFDWDAGPWKPTVISVELGMNDASRFTPEAYLTISS